MDDDTFVLLLLFVVAFVGLGTGMWFGNISKQCPPLEVPSLVLNLPKEAAEPVQDLATDGFNCKIINNEVYITVVCDFEPVGP